MNRLYYLLSVMFILVQTSCIQEVVEPTNALPVVETLTVTKLPNNQLLLSGKISNKGAAEVEDVGFCFSRKEIPSLLDNQRKATLNNGIFSVVVDEFYPLDTIYVRAFAGNRYGFSEGQNQFYVVERNAAPVVPCTLDSNTYFDGTFTINANSIFMTKSTKYTKVEIYTSMTDIEIGFNTEQVTSGIYTINNSWRSSPQTCDMHITNYTMNDGGLVYVTEREDGFLISFCDVTFNVGNYVVHTKGNFRVYN